MRRQELESLAIQVVSVFHPVAQACFVKVASAKLAEQKDRSVQEHGEAPAPRASPVSIKTVAGPAHRAVWRRR